MSLYASSTVESCDRKMSYLINAQSQDSQGGGGGGGGRGLGITLIRTADNLHGVAPSYPLLKCHTLFLVCHFQHPVGSAYHLFLFQTTPMP